MKVYFDSVSTTSINDEVLETYKKLLDKYYANSDALYDDGVAIYNMQEKSRSGIASTFKVNNNEVIFTSGSSEANSLAIKGLCLGQNTRKQIITSYFEHSSVYNSIKQLENNFGFKVIYLKPINGIISAKQVEEVINQDTILVSIMCVNNEIGSINDIENIKEVVKKNSGTYLHVDFTQALGKLDINLKDIDLASFSMHKIHGLKGSGFLIKKQHVNLLPLISGGQQEFGIRGGTSNALVNALAYKTLRIALENKDKNNKRIHELNIYLRDKLKEIPSISINEISNYVDNIISIQTPLTSEVMMNSLNKYQIMVSSKSTCGSRSNENSRSIISLGKDDNYTIRISLEASNSIEEIDYVIKCLKEIINKYGI